MDFTPGHNKDTFVTRKEGATVARTFWVLFIQICVCEEKEGGAGGEEDAACSGADLGEPPGRARAALRPHRALTASFHEYLLSTLDVPGTRKHFTLIDPQGPQPSRSGRPPGCLGVTGPCPQPRGALWGAADRPPTRSLSAHPPGSLSLPTAAQLANPSGDPLAPAPEVSPLAGRDPKPNPTKRQMSPKLTRPPI